MDTKILGEAIEAMIREAVREAVAHAQTPAPAAPRKRALSSLFAGLDGLTPAEAEERVRRRLYRTMQNEGLQLRRTRGKRAKEIGEFHIYDLRNGSIVETHVDVGEVAKRYDRSRNK